MKRSIFWVVLCVLNSFFLGYDFVSPTPTTGGVPLDIILIGICVFGLYSNLKTKEVKNG